MTTAGGIRANEDRAGHAGSLAWVIDGATDLYDEAALPAESDVQWLVDLVVERLRQAGMGQYSGSGAALLDEISQHICDQMAAHAFPARRVPPACSLVVTVDRGESYEITRVGDATAVVCGAEPAVLATDFFDRREARAVAAQRDGVPSDQLTAGKHERRLETMTGGAAESIFSGHVDRVLRPYAITGRWPTTRAALLCSDGFARLITDYRVYDEWSDVVAEALDKGLACQEKLLRDLEADTTRTWPERFKRADDVAAVLLTPEGRGVVAEGRTS